MVAVAKVMFKMIALIFEDIDGFIFNFPACASELAGRDDILISQLMVGNPGVAEKSVATFFLSDEPFAPVDGKCILA